MCKLWNDSLNTSSEDPGNSSGSQTGSGFLDVASANLSQITETDVELSWTTIEFLFPLSVFWIVSSLAMISSSLLLMCALRRLLLIHKNFYWAVWHLSLADLFVGIVCCYIGAKRANFYALRQPQLSSAQECAVDMGLLVFALLASITQAFGVALDRLIAISMPIYYHMRLKPRHLAPLNLCLWLFDLVFASVAVTSGRRNAKCFSVCTLNGALTAEHFKRLIDVFTVLPFLLVSVYVVAMLCVHIRVNKTLKHHHGDASKSSKKQLQAQVLIGLSVLVSVYTVTWIASSVALQFIYSFSGLEGSTTATHYLLTLMSLSSATNFYNYAWKHEEVKKEFWRVFRRCRKRNQVAPTPAPAGVAQQKQPTT